MAINSVVTWGLGCGRRGWGGSLRLADYKMEVLRYSTGSSIQYLVINLNGKNMKKNIYIHTRVKLNHFAVQKK